MVSTKAKCIKEWRDHMFGWGNKIERKPVVVPDAIKPEDPVNYNSVLDYLVGLSKTDYSKMIKSADIYRDANAKVAKVVGIKDEPTTSIKNEPPELTDDDLNAILDAGPEDLSMAFIEDDLPEDKPSKPQSTKKKVEVKAGQ